MVAVVETDRVRHFTRIPVEVGGQRERFLFDSGIGINVVSSSLAMRLDLVPTGDSFTGRRMSGQSVTADLVHLPTLRIGTEDISGQIAGVVDLGPDDGPDGFAGIVGLPAVMHHSVTVDPVAKTLTLRPGGTRPAAGFQVPLQIERTGPSMDPFTRLVLPNGDDVRAELDTGSDALILNSALLDSGRVSVVGDLDTCSGEDETGNRYLRRMGNLEGSVHLADAPETSQTEPRVLFQDIIYDALVGSDFLDRFRYTIDVTTGTLTLEAR